MHEIASEYIAARCPDNLAYGGLHEDKDHSYHMHLMISANRVAEPKRQRLTKHQFRDIQVKLEAHVLQTYPELEQKLAIGKRSDRGRNKGEAELERRTGKRPKREEILERIGAAYEGSLDRDSLLSALGREGLELYVRGKTIGVVDLESGKKHRLKTLDFEMADQIEIRLAGQELDIQGEAEKNLAGEQEKERGAEAARESPERGQSERIEPEADKDMYVKKPRSTKASKKHQRYEAFGHSYTASNKSDIIAESPELRSGLWLSEPAILGRGQWVDGGHVPSSGACLWQRQYCAQTRLVTDLFPVGFLPRPPLELQSDARVLCPSALLQKPAPLQGLS